MRSLIEYLDVVELDRSFQVKETKLCYQPVCQENPIQDSVSCVLGSSEGPNVAMILDDNVGMGEKIRCLLYIVC